MAEERVQRRLAAILAADVAGYSRLMGEDEEATLATLKSHREIIDGLIAGHQGRVFGGAVGDVLLLGIAAHAWDHASEQMPVPEHLRRAQDS